MTLEFKIAQYDVPNDYLLTQHGAPFLYWHGRVYAGDVGSDHIQIVVDRLYDLIAAEGIEDYNIGEAADIWLQKVQPVRGRYRPTSVAFWVPLYHDDLDHEELVDIVTQLQHYGVGRNPKLIFSSESKAYSFADIQGLEQESSLRLSWDVKPDIIVIAIPNQGEFVFNLETHTYYNSWALTAHSPRRGHEWNFRYHDGQWESSPPENPDDWVEFIDPLQDELNIKLRKEANQKLSWEVVEGFRPGDRVKILKKSIGSPLRYIGSAIRGTVIQVIEPGTKQWTALVSERYSPLVSRPPAPNVPIVVVIPEGLNVDFFFAPQDLELLESKTSSLRFSWDVVQEDLHFGDVVRILVETPAHTNPGDWSRDMRGLLGSIWSIPSRADPRCVYVVSYHDDGHSWGANFYPTDLELVNPAKVESSLKLSWDVVGPWKGARVKTLVARPASGWNDEVPVGSIGTVISVDDPLPWGDPAYTVHVSLDDLHPGEIFYGFKPEDLEVLPESEQGQERNEFNELVTPEPKWWEFWKKRSNLKLSWEVAPELAVGVKVKTLVHHPSSLGRAVPAGTIGTVSDIDTTAVEAKSIGVKFERYDPDFITYLYAPGELEILTKTTESSLKLAWDVVSEFQYIGDWLDAGAPELPVGTKLQSGNSRASSWGVLEVVRLNPMIFENHGPGARYFRWVLRPSGLGTWIWSDDLEELANREIRASLWEVHPDIQNFHQWFKAGAPDLPVGFTILQGDDRSKGGPMLVVHTAPTIFQGTRSDVDQRYYLYDRQIGIWRGATSVEELLQHPEWFQYLTTNTSLWEVEPEEPPFDINAPYTVEGGTPGSRWIINFNTMKATAELDQEGGEPERNEVYLASPEGTGRSLWSYNLGGMEESHDIQGPTSARIDQAYRDWLAKRAKVSSLKLSWEAAFEHEYEIGSQLIPKSTDEIFTVINIIPASTLPSTGLRDGQRLYDDYIRHHDEWDDLIKTNEEILVFETGRAPDHDDLLWSTAETIDQYLKDGIWSLGTATRSGLKLAWEIWDPAAPIEIQGSHPNQTLFVNFAGMVAQSKGLAGSVLLQLVHPQGQTYWHYRYPDDVRARAFAIVVQERLQAAYDQWLEQYRDWPRNISRTSSRWEVLPDDVTFVESDLIWHIDFNAMTYWIEGGKISKEAPAACRRLDLGIRPGWQFRFPLDEYESNRSWRDMPVDHAGKFEALYQRWLHGKTASLWEVIPESEMSQISDEELIRMIVDMENYFNNPQTGIGSSDLRFYNQIHDERELRSIAEDDPRILEGIMSQED